MSAICGVLVVFMIALVRVCGDAPGQQQREQSSEERGKEMGPHPDTGSAYKSGGDGDLTPEKMMELFVQWAIEEGTSFYDEADVRRLAYTFMGGYKAAIYYSVIARTPVNTTPAPGPSGPEHQAPR
jgi:hypothetical protein